MMINRIAGYVLLGLGLVLIGWTLWYSYSIFNGKTSAPLVFKTPVPLQTAGNTTDIQIQINNAVKQQLGQILPAEAITKILNLLSWSILAGIFILGGGAIAGIGVKLVKL